MAITITPAPCGPWLKLEGDIEAVLNIPAHPPEETKNGRMVDSYYISFSDGTLIQASHDDDPEFYLVVEGAARVTVAQSGKELFVDWDIEWVNVASRCGAMALVRREPMSLPLLDLLNEAA